MRLGDLITAETKINEEIMICREMEVLEGEVLLLAIQKGEFYVESEEAVASATRILALYDAPEPEDDEDDDWEEVDEWDEDLVQFDDDNDVMTNRQAILNEKEEFEPEILDITEIVINGKEYQVFEAEESFMEEQPHDAVIAVKRADEAGALPARWHEKNLDDMAMVEYIVEDSMMEVAWDADILSIDFNFTEEAVDDEVLCGKVIKCTCGKLDVPVTFDIKSPSGKTVDVTVYGTHKLDIWQDAEMLGLDEEELEEICSSDQRLLVVEYETSEEAILNFYTKDFLDARYNEGNELPELILGMEEHELRLVDVVYEDFDDEVELELLTYEVFED